MTPTEFFFPLFVSGGQGFGSFAQETRIYADPESIVQFTIDRAAADASSCKVGLSGYTVPK